MLRQLRTVSTNVLRQWERQCSVYVPSSSQIDAALANNFGIESTGSIVPYEGDYSQEKCDLRRYWVEQYAGTSLRNLSQWWKEGNRPDLLKRHAEMPIGLVKVPLAVAGPLQINGNFARGNFLAPLTTTEGEVVALTNSGAEALNNSGGVQVYASKLKMSGCPVFEMAKPEDAHDMGEWLKTRQDQIQQEVVNIFSKDIILKEIQCIYDLELVHVLLNYETDVSIDQDIIASISSKVAKWISQKAPKILQLQKYWNESHLLKERSYSKLNMVLGHGLSCGAEAVMTEEVLKRNLGFSKESIMFHYKYLESIVDHTLPLVGDTTKLIAALFGATGQDLGNYLDVSNIKAQHTINEGKEGGVKYTLWIPSLVVKTHFNGCDLPTQRQCLEMMGCYGPNNIRKLGEIVAAFTLAQNISTYGAMAKRLYPKAPKI